MYTRSQEPEGIGLCYGAVWHSCEILTGNWLLLAQINVKIGLD